MKAFLLAAGEGTRLRPITLDIPKCLVSVNGRPLIEYWFDLFEKYGIDEILVNTSHLSEKVKHYLKNISSNIKIHITYEEHILGSGGTIKANWSFVDKEDLYFIFYADNLTNINLRKMKVFHSNKRKDISLAILRVPNPGDCGIVELDNESTIIAFSEKPENPVSDLAFAGIMLCDNSLKHYFPDRDVFDLGYDVLPLLAGKAAGYVMDEYLLDIGTPKKLHQAEYDVKHKRYLLI